MSSNCGGKETSLALEFTEQQVQKKKICKACVPYFYASYLILLFFAKENLIYLVLFSEDLEVENQCGCVNCGAFLD